MCGVGVGIGRVADDDERQRRVARGVALDDDVDVVLGLEPGDDEVVPPRRQVELGEALRPLRFDDRRAVA